MDRDLHVYDFFFKQLVSIECFNNNCNRLFRIAGIGQSPGLIFVFRESLIGTRFIINIKRTFLFFEISDIFILGQGRIQFLYRIALLRKYEHLPLMECVDLLGFYGFHDLVLFRILHFRGAFHHGVIIEFIGSTVNGDLLACEAGNAMISVNIRRKICRHVRLIRFQRFHLFINLVHQLCCGFRIAARCKRQRAQQYRDQQNKKFFH